jgi:hypothetical protein
MFDVFYFGDKPGLFAFEQPATSLEDAANKCKTTHYWYIYGGNDYTGFDFEYVPVPWETDHLHVWPSQHQRNGEVYLANRRTHQNQQWHFHTEQSVVRKPDRGLWQVPNNIDDTDFDYSWHPDRTEPDYEYRFPTQWQREGGPVYPGTAGVKYMTDQRIRAGATQIFYMDFLNGGIARHQFDLLKLDHPDIKRTRYVDNHLNVFKRIMNMATTEYVWIISSICDYTQFDFTWHPSEAQREMIHCFPSGNQRRGDTFYIHVPSFTQQMFELELLDWFNVINYSDDQQVERFGMPVQQYSTDDLVTEIKNYKFETPYVMFTNQTDLVLHDNPCLWTKKDRTVVRVSTAGATAIVPRDIKEDLRTQIYDYPYIEDAKPRLNDYLGGRDCLDIVYISNGEPDEERWYDHLCYQSNYQAKWVRGINGRTAAYQEAARQSATPWFFAVFAKLEVLGNVFPWHTWLPDYFQEPKHYIFNSRNPVNGLEYGHQGVIAYNKRLVLENNTPGIDFTLSQPHESVPILSGVAHYNQSEWMTWRTAFREVVKLKHFMATAPTLETEHRLNVWSTVADGDFAEWSLRGAKDAVDYYTEVNGNYEKLMFSFEWAWLNNRFNLLYLV